jgi:uncharacterized protein
MERRTSHVIVKIAERCNLNCTYCYMYNHVDQTYQSRPAFMSLDTFSDLLVRIREHLGRTGADTVSLTFHGGEPMLVQPGRLRLYLDRAVAELGARIRFSMQTNGTLVTDEWIDLLKAYRVSVCVSIDGLPDVHDKWRVYADGRGSHAQVVRGLRALQDGGVGPTALCVIQPGAAGLATYRYLRDLGLTFLGFKFPEICHDSPAIGSNGTSDTPIADCLIPIFDEWYSQDDARIRIKGFEELIRAILTESRDGDDRGLGPINYLVVESDGSIHGPDELRVCESALSTSGLNVRTHSFDDLRVGSPLIYQLATDGLPPPTPCRGCPELGVCGGGNPAHRYSRGNGFDNRSVWCADMLRLIAHIRNVIGMEHAYAPVAGTQRQGR